MFMMLLTGNSISKSSLSSKSCCCRQSSVYSATTIHEIIHEAFHTTGELRSSAAESLHCTDRLSRCLEHSEVDHAKPGAWRCRKQDRDTVHSCIWTAGYVDSCRVYSAYPRTIWVSYAGHIRVARNAFAMPAMSSSFFSDHGLPVLALHQNRQTSKISITRPKAANGPYCFNSSSQLILTAALRYFALSSLNRLLMSPIFSRLSPRYNRSSMFFVITCVTSFNSSFSLPKFPVARLSW